MGSSTIQLTSVFDYVRARGVPTPQGQAAGYTLPLALRLAQNVMNDLIAERFNWKWNRATAPQFLTNSFQQDYAGIGLTGLGWLEDCDVVDINNTSIPLPLGNATVRRQLSRVGQYIGYGPRGVFDQSICWMYNKDLFYGVWPGAGVVYTPLLTQNVVQNPLMQIKDANGNLLVVTTFGTTGSVAPLLPAGSAEGTTVTDGSVVWTVAGPNSQGFRVFPLPGPTGPVYQFTPYYQVKAPTFTAMANTIDPIPDDYSNVFFDGLEWQCKGASPNPADRKAFDDGYGKWLKRLEDTRKQGDREADSYAMLPASSPVENVYGWLRNPQDPSQPY